MDFQYLLAQNGGFGGQNRGTVGAILTPNELVLTFESLLPRCHFWRKSIKKCDRESARTHTRTQTDRQTDRHTLWWRQTEFIICPMLYAI